MSDNTHNRVQQDPFLADGSDRINNVQSFSSPFHISSTTHSNNLSSSNILRLGSLNVRSLVSPTKQLNLFSILLSCALHGIILTETNLCSPAHHYICNPYLNSYNYHSWFTHSPTANRHSGMGIILHSSLAMYVVKKKFYSDRLIGLTLQLPGKRNILIIGGYVPPVSSSNRSVIADCYFTLISWICSARSLDHSVLLGGDLNADFESFLKQLTAAHPGSLPLNPLFKFLHEQQFDDLCELDTHFDFLELRDHHAPSYLKQRQQCRTSYDFHSASFAQKESFASAVSALLPAVSSLSCGVPLNQLWHQFKTSLLSASRFHFPRINISLSRPKDIPHELQPYTRLSNSLTHFIISLRKKTTILQLQLAWSRITLEFDKFKSASIKSAVAERNENFYENKGKFISSSLNRERRCIVLDRVLVVDLPDSPKLLVAPEEIKVAAITHFQNVVGPSVSPFDSLATLPPRWRK
ncbi:unnamed protein product [Rhizophagus irregularis]|nr:unnamed protein product [Rhizophagus irregularis]